ncbi:MAG: hypothetical protein O7G87_23885, partial [bacterium]|nr:hypothetical protein [bacterium]
MDRRGPQKPTTHLPLCHVGVIGAETLADCVTEIRNRWNQTLGGGNRPSTPSIAHPRANSDWS